MIIMCDLAGGHTKPTGNTQVIRRFRSKIHRQFSVRHLTLVGVTRQQYQEPGALPHCRTYTDTTVVQQGISHGDGQAQSGAAGNA